MEVGFVTIVVLFTHHLAFPPLSSFSLQVRNPGSQNVRQHNQTHREKDAFDATKKRPSSKQIKDWIEKFSDGFKCRPRNAKKGRQVVLSQSGEVTSKRMSNGRGDEETVQSDALECWVTQVISYVHSFIHSLIILFIYPFTHSFVRSFIHSCMTH